MPCLAAVAHPSLRKTPSIRRRLGLGVMALILAASLPAAETSLTIDRANSRIGMAVKVTVDSFAARLADFAPTVLVDPATGRVTAARIGFHFADVKTGDEKRDREMNAWQQTEKFPDGDFTLATLEPSADGKWRASGALTLHGVKRVMTFPVQVKRDGSAFTVEGEVGVDTRDFGLPVIRKFALLKVDPLVTVQFHLVAVLAAP